MSPYTKHPGLGVRGQVLGGSLFKSSKNTQAASRLWPSVSSFIIFTHLQLRLTADAQHTLMDNVDMNLGQTVSDTLTFLDASTSWLHCLLHPS